MTVGASSLSDSGYNTDQGDYRDCSPFARWTVQSSLTNLTINGYTNLYDNYPQFSHLGLIVDGTYNQTLECVQSGANTWYVALPAGDKTIEIVAGLQSAPGGVLMGTYPVSVSGVGTVTEVAPVLPASRLLFYGDSIIVGANSTYPTQSAMPVLLRASFAGSVMVEGYGGRGLYYDCIDAAARQTFANLLASFSPTTIWLTMGTNDYGKDGWSAADFGTAYADLLDKLRVALPAAAIYCQSPLVRADESANSFGDTLGDYRTQIQTVCTAREWATYVDGSTILLVADLDADGVHPTTEGHAKWATAVETTLGL